MDDDKENSNTEVKCARNGSTMVEENICRLCLNTTDSKKTIFEEECCFNLSQIINDLFQINYEKLPLLPSHICQRCLFMVESFKQFKEIVRQCETELKKYLQHFLETKELNRTPEQIPGLNGNPGIFKPEQNCKISEVNPNEDFETSEDEFSMESDSEADLDIAMPSKTNSIVYENNTYLTDTNISVSLIPLDITMTSVRDKGYSNEQQNKNTYLCEYCDMAFTTSSERTDHEKHHDIGNPYVCAFCPMRTSNRPHLIHHIRETHDPERPFICAHCKKGFCRRSDLKKHTIVHTGVRPFKCPSCSKGFSRNTNLTKHMRIHSSERPHVCQLCPRSFTTAAELHLHARTHEEVKPFRCGRCSSSFTRRDKLVLHERTHSRRDSELQLSEGGVTSKNHASETGISNFPILNPGKNVIIPLTTNGQSTVKIAENSTYDNGILAAQLLQRLTPLPTGRQSHVRSVKCEICAMSFSRERDLQRHQALHLDTLFTCKQCGKSFNRREKLMRHENEIHAPQYQCTICHITFNKTADLEMHRKVHEIQQTVAMNAQAAVNSRTGGYQTSNFNTMIPQTQTQRPSAANLSFYTNMVPTINLGFYSETKLEERNNS